MKKAPYILTALSLVLLLFSGCNAFETSLTDAQHLTLSPASTVCPTNTSTITQPPFSVALTAENCFHNYGYSHFECTVSGEYGVAADNAGNADVQWRVYVLDEEFTDADRYIAQTYTSILTNSGAITVNAGQYIYVYCSVNCNTASYPATGAKVILTLTQP